MRKHLKWIIPVIVVLAIVMYLFSASGMGKVATDITQAYADEDLYKNAIEKANYDQEVISTIGKIKPIDKMAIFNGEVVYSDNNQIVNSTIKISGEKGKAKLDITAKREQEAWEYEKINLRIQDPENNKKTIEIIKGI